LVRYGPTYLLIGSSKWSDMVIVRLVLTGLNSWGREWGETIVVEGNDTLANLDKEVEEFRWLEHRLVDELGTPNIVLAFVESRGYNPEVPQWLDKAKQRGIPTYMFGEWPRRKHLIQRRTPKRPSHPGGTM
jgi:hypothetical protein